MKYRIAAAFTLICWDCFEKKRMSHVKNSDSCSRNTFPHVRIPIKWIRFLVFLVVVGISLFILSVRDRASELANYGYPGIFLMTALANGTVLIPVPGIAVVFALGSVFTPLGVGIAAGAGAAVGEMSGYMAGFSGQAVIEKQKAYSRILGWLSHNILITTLVFILMSAIPNPLYDLFGMAAGALRIKAWHFFIATLVGKTVEMLIVAFAGAYSIEWFARFLG